MKNRSPHLASMRDRVTQLAVSLFVFIALLPACLPRPLHAQGPGSADPQLVGQQEKLQSAVKKGDAAEVRSLLGQRVDPDAPLARGGMIRANGLEVLQGSPLQWAAHSGRADILRDLLKAGADPHEKGIDDWEVPWPSPVTEVGWTLLGWLNEAGPPKPASRPNRFAVGNPLGAAALGGDLEIVRILVEEAGISPDDRELTSQGEETGWTALMYAAISGHGEVATYLLEKGANISAGDREYGYQALHFAARAGSADAVSALLGAGADPGARDLLGQTPLHLAATNKDPSCCRLLLAAGAEVGAKTRLGWTALHLAAVNGRTQVCVALLDAKALVDAKDFLGRTPLHLAAATGQNDICRVLLARGANPLETTEADLTPLHFAAASGDVNTLLLLHQAGADVNGRDKLGYTPLHCAAWLNHEKSAALLILRGARVKAEGEEGFTPLHVALLEDARATVPLLLVLGADPNAPDHDGWTPLHIAAACRLDYFEATGPMVFSQDEQQKAQAQSEWQAQVRRLPVNRLLEFGAQPSLRNRAGQTPLHIAAWAVNLMSMVGGDASLQCRVLLEHGAAVNAEDEEGRTPLDVAIDRHGSTAEEILRAAGGRHGTPRSKQDLNRWLVAAVSGGDLDRARELLDLGADVNTSRDEEGDSPLALAADPCSGGQAMDTEGGVVVRKPSFMGADSEKKAVQAQLVALLLNRGADPKGVGRWGGSLLHTAVDCGDLDLIKTLLEAGADPNQVNKAGETPLHLAAKFDMASGRPMVEALVAAGAKLNVANENGRTPADAARESRYISMANLLDKLGEDSDDVTRKGSHAGLDQHQTELLFTAVREGDREAARDAVKAGADLRARDANGRTLAYIAAGDDDVAMLEFLAETGVDLSAPSRWGQTPFDLAVKTSEKLTRWFAEHGALPKTKDGAPPHLGMVGTWMTPPTIRLLVSLGFAVDAPPGEWSLLTSVAVYPDQVRTLLELGANPNSKGPHGRTALHNAADGFEGTYSQESVDLLIAAGAEVNAPEDNGQTPAHEAAIYQRIGMLDALARAGADLALADQEGVTPMALAMSRYDLQTAV